MKKGIAVLLLLLFTGCKGQEKDQTDKKNQEDQETAEMPKGQWEVQKEYDELGNLIKYDSIYSYAYSNIEGDSLRVNLDSIMDSFRGYFKGRDPFSGRDRIFLFSPSRFPVHERFFFERLLFQELGTPTIGNGGHDETNGFDAERLYEATPSGLDGVQKKLNGQRSFISISVHWQIATSRPFKNCTIDQESS